MFSSPCFKCCITVKWCNFRSLSGPHEICRCFLWWLRVKICRNEQHLFLCLWCDWQHFLKMTKIVLKRWQERFVYAWSLYSHNWRLFIKYFTVLILCKSTISHPYRTVATSILRFLVKNVIFHFVHITPSNYLQDFYFL